MALDRQTIVAKIRHFARQGKVQFTAKALREIRSLGLGLGLDTTDACDLIAHLKESDLIQRIQSATSNEPMFVFKTRFEFHYLYIKIVLRPQCVVISFHEDMTNE